jgi:hypothetical protein
MRTMRRGIDLVLAICFLVLCAPVFLLLACCVVMWSGPPIFVRIPVFRRDGHLFWRFQFRTIDLVPHSAADNWRITPFGAWLRRTSLDELPALINVLRGEMTLTSPPNETRSHRASPQMGPPATAERVLCYLLPRRRREEILGDLAEDYWTEFLPKFGLRAARRMYWSQFARSVAATVPAGAWAAAVGAIGWLWGKLGS